MTSSIALERGFEEPARGYVEPTDDVEVSISANLHMSGAASSANLDRRDVGRANRAGIIGEGGFHR